MKDDFKINLEISGRNYPLPLDRTDMQAAEKREEIARKAAKMVTKMVADYEVKFRHSKELHKQDFLAMTAFHFANLYYQLEQSKGDEVFAQLVKTMDKEVQTYLKKL